MSPVASTIFEQSRQRAIKTQDDNDPRRQYGKLLVKLARSESLDDREQLQLGELTRHTSSQLFQRHIDQVELVLDFQQQQTECQNDLTQHEPLGKLRRELEAARKDMDAAVQAVKTQHEPIIGKAYTRFCERDMLEGTITHLEQSVAAVRNGNRTVFLI